MALERWLRAFLLTASLAKRAVIVRRVPKPPKFAHVSGVVIDERDGRLLRRARVCLNRGADSGSDSTTVHCDETDAQGRFNIANLPPSRYSPTLSNAKDTFKTSPPPMVCRH